jgi:hypothetical protein
MPKFGDFLTPSRLIAAITISAYLWIVFSKPAPAIAELSMKSYSAELVTNAPTQLYFENVFLYDKDGNQKRRKAPDSGEVKTCSRKGGYTGDIELPPLTRVEVRAIQGGMSILLEPKFPIIVEGVGSMTEAIRLEIVPSSDCRPSSSLLWLAGKNILLGQSWQKLDATSNPHIGLSGTFSLFGRSKSFGLLPRSIYLVSQTEIPYGSGVSDSPEPIDGGEAPNSAIWAVLIEVGNTTATDTGANSLSGLSITARSENVNAIYVSGFRDVPAGTAAEGLLLPIKVSRADRLLKDPNILLLQLIALGIAAILGIISNFKQSFLVAKK